jgi:hypothetical protein
MSVGKLRISSHLSEEIAGRQQHSEEDQAADERQRVAPQHALAGLVKAVVIGAPVMAIIAFRRKRLDWGYAGPIIPRDWRAPLDWRPPMPGDCRPDPGRASG